MAVVVVEEEEVIPCKVPQYKKLLLQAGAGGGGGTRKVTLRAKESHDDCSAARVTNSVHEPSCIYTSTNFLPRTLSYM